MAQGKKEGRTAEKPWQCTPGKILTAPAIFANGIPGSPAAPKTRGDAKQVGTGQYPTSYKNAKNDGPYKAFGIRSGDQSGRGGKRGMSD